ncbi:MAG: hypothetical protein QJR02_07175 [Sinobacteraceae bacterium]|nr:hypothetical protein [Nevskiaceae bacterium]
MTEAPGRAALSSDLALIIAGPRCGSVVEVLSNPFLATTFTVTGIPQRIRVNRVRIVGGREYYIRSAHLLPLCAAHKEYPP